MNLTNPQFVVSKNPKAAAPSQAAFPAPHHMANRPNSFFRPAPAREHPAPVSILTRNPRMPSMRVASTTPYTNVAQGIKPAPAPAAPVSHQAHMQATLNSFAGAPRGGRGRSFHAQPRPHPHPHPHPQPIASGHPGPHGPPPFNGSTRGRGAGRGGRGRPAPPPSS